MITFNHVSKAYDSRVIIKNLSFSLSSGSITLLVGENGVGKTTLLNLIAGVEMPDSGTISIAEKTVGYIGHQVAVYPLLSATENLLFWARLCSLKPSSQDILTVLERVKLASFANQPAKIFSRGMLQRLNLARIFLIKPDVLLLDEPSTGLDKTSVKILYKEILDAKEQGACILWSSHYPELDKTVADTVMILKDNTITLLDTNEYSQMTIGISCS